VVDVNGSDRELPVLRGDRVVLRPVTPADIERLTAILAEPEVARWWGAVGAEEARKDFLGDAAPAFVIEVDSEVVGCIQYHEEAEPDYRHAGIDIFVRTERQGRGLGADALRTLARHLFEGRGHHRLTIDPAAANEQAIRTYRRIGFRPVGVMRRYERGPDGVWRDGLLMDLLRDELR
jgi:aminoglycoside 6'-N-acetyltransferase